MDLRKSLICEPIGIIRTEMQVKFDAPRQPDSTQTQHHIIELFPGHRYEDALRDLAGFERIWLIWWFDRNPNWRPMVRTPRGDTHRRGVFATRSPHRPNPIGMTNVPLIEVRGRELVVGPTDLLDRTPILDIKPYISAVDSYPDQRQGWLEEVEAQGAVPLRYVVTISPRAEEQFAWLAANWQIDFASKIRRILERDPSPSRRNRITGERNGLFRMSSGSWRVFFSVDGTRVTVYYVAPGFPMSLLTKEGFEVIPHYQAQLAFEQLWPSDSVSSAGSDSE
jgi:tRNA-Thr(GGU) m(6)t(6)A37 methyltransferase TsaA